MPTGAENTPGFTLAAGAAERYEREVAPVMAPFVAAIVGAAVRRGDRVLDVASGTGFAARAAAVAAGEDGAVAGVDVNPEMIELARTLPASGAPTAWHTASALDLPFDDGRFDAVLCQQGVQFFPDPVAGLREMRRVGRPGAALAATVWAPLDESPYFAAQLGALIDGVDLERRVADVAFPPGGADGLRGWAEDAGWPAPRIERVERAVDLPPLDRYVPAHLAALPWASGWLKLPPADRADLSATIIASLTAFRRPDGGASVPTTTLLVTARA